MLRNREINNFMSTVSLSLMSNESPKELWVMYDLLLAWKLNVEWDNPGIGTDRSQEIGRIILKQLETMPDRNLAKEIEHIVTMQAV